MGLFVVASNRSWNVGLAESLALRTRHTFVQLFKSDDLSLEVLRELSPAKVFFPHWSTRIPKEIFDEFECLIFHMTDLPFGRGGSPLQNLIIRGYRDTKITALKCTEQLDGGPIYLKQDLSLKGTAEEIFTRANSVIEDMIIQIIENAPIPLPQIGEATYFSRRQLRDSEIVSTDTLRLIFDKIRMLDAEGYPSAFIQIGQSRFEFSNASYEGKEIIATVCISASLENEGQDNDAI